MGALLNFTATLEDAGECPTCGVRFAIPSNLLRALRESKKLFYCPSGHQQSFTTSRTEQLERELAAAKARVERAEDLAKQRDQANQQLYKTKQQLLGKLRALKTRVKNGVCPCCSRSFVGLARHIATKHPDYAKQLIADDAQPEETSP